jgi:peptide-methionine (S)-S-oxide reductase
MDTQLATLAGGCFWCTEAVFKRLKGVLETISGYGGAKMDNPTYEKVSSGNTGAVEAIQIKFDPRQISFEKLLEVFWATHDPTTLNRQGADVGTEYRSVIFYHNPEQKQIAERSLSKHNIEFKDSIVTKIEPFSNFYTAEEYHQNFYDLNKDSNAYCSIVIDPKIKKLLEKFNSEVKEEYKT